MHFPDSWFEDEVRNGFYIPALIKRSWAAQLEVLEEIAKMCDRHHIKWFAIYGTLLGVVRHSGFVPWDDDLDIGMLREDYERFKMVAEQELPDGYYMPLDPPDEYQHIGRVFNGKHISVNKERLEKYHGFPYVVGIDIFVLDYIAPNPKDEENRKRIAAVVRNAAATINESNQDTEEMQSLVGQIETLVKVKLDRSKPLKSQLYALCERLFSLYTAEESTQIAHMPHWICNREEQPFPAQYIGAPIRLPFEITSLPVPADFHNFLYNEYGDYTILYRRGGWHDYPSYRDQEQQLMEAIGEPAPFQYYFSKEDLYAASLRDDIRQYASYRDFVPSSGRIHQKIRECMDGNNPQTAKKLLEGCQKLAICLGGRLERAGDKAGTAPAVKLLEEYCELVWAVYNGLDDAGSIGDNVLQRLDGIMERIQEHMKDHKGLRREIVFLPWKASMWHKLEPYWNAAVDSPDCDVYVIPVPYYYRKLDGSFYTMCYEGKDLPEHVQITDYNDYDWESHNPDVVFIQNPYDGYNLTTSVHPFFYSEHLRQYTEQLIYIPWFTLDETEPDEPKAMYNMKYHAAMPGVVHADRTIVQSELIRKVYIDFLSCYTGEETRSIWEEKITVPGKSAVSSPPVDCGTK